MNCRSYQTRLTDAVASGASLATLDFDLRTHLAGCASCASAFESDRALFFAMDQGLRLIADEPVPDSLLASLRAAIAKVSQPTQELPIWQYVAIGAALILVATLTLHLRHGTDIDRVSPVASSARAPSAVAEASSFMSTRPSHLEHAAADRIDASRGSKPVALSIGHPSSEKEILVPTARREALFRYVRRWKSGAVLPFNFQTAATGDEVSELEEIADLRIYDLNVLPLLSESETDGQGPK